MPRVVPSQVVELIDQLFPNAKTTTQINVHVGATAYLHAILAYAREIPQELLTLVGQDLSDYTVSLAMIERVQQLWIAGGGHWNLTDYRGMSPIHLLRAALAKCPDEAPAPGTADLTFIADGDLRESIRRDISAANQDMANGEWKGATVLAGSATEALLLWSIEDTKGKNRSVIQSAIARCLASKALFTKPKGDPDRWYFIDLIEVAFELGAIKEPTAKQARLGKNFRNLIHPGRAARLGEVCDRGTALSALAAVELVVRDLS